MVILERPTMLRRLKNTTVKKLGNTKLPDH
jgi:hypothetical protein